MSIKLTNILNEGKVSEGTWAFPKAGSAQEQQLLELIADLRKNPSNLLIKYLYNIFGDDELFDALENLYKNIDNKAANLIETRYNKLQTAANEEKIGKLKKVKKAVGKWESRVRTETNKLKKKM